MIRLEIHGIDDGNGIGATVTFVPMLDSDFKHEAVMVLVGLIDISVPPGSNAQLHQQVAAPAITLGSQLVVMSGHQHKAGVDIAIGDSVDGGAPANLYDSTSWNMPPVTMLTPLTMTSGTKLDLTCSWQNNGNSALNFGKSFQNEQCFARAHFAPATGSRLCVHTEKSGTVDACCPGDALCSSL
jgi:hypothetical protein